MKYPTQIPFPPGVRRVRIKPEHASCLDLPRLAYVEFGRTWFVYNRETRVVEAMFYRTINTHGFDPSWYDAMAYAFGNDMKDATA